MLGFHTNKLHTNKLHIIINMILTFLPRRVCMSAIIGSITLKRIEMKYKIQSRLHTISIVTWSNA